MRNRMAHRNFDTAHAYVWATIDHDLEPRLTPLHSLETRLDDKTD